MSLPGQTNQNSRSVVCALWQGKAALTYEEIAAAAGLSLGEARAAVKRLRQVSDDECGVVTSQNMRTKVTHHFLAVRADEAMGQLLADVEGGR